MAHKKFKFVSRLSTATLVSSLTLGIFPALPTNVSVAASSIEAASTLPNLEDPAIEELILLVEASQYMQYPFWYGVDPKDVWAVNTAQQEAILALANPNVSATQISAAYRHLQNEFDDYGGFFIQDQGDFEQFLEGEHLYITEFWGTVTTPPYSPVQNALLQALDDAAAMAAEAGNDQKRYLEAHRYYRIEARRVSDYRLEGNNPAFALAGIENMRRQVAETLPIVESLGVNVAQQVENFEKSISLWSAVAQSNKLYKRTAYVAIRTNADRHGYLFEKMRTLADLVITATVLLDAPRGIRSGQYPASAFGELNRAINDAKRKLETARAWEEMEDAANVLNGAVAQFQSSIKP